MFAERGHLLWRINGDASFIVIFCILQFNFIMHFNHTLHISSGKKAEKTQCLMGLWFLGKAGTKNNFGRDMSVFTENQS